MQILDSHLEDITRTEDHVCVCCPDAVPSKGARAAGDHRGPQSLNKVKVEGTTGIDSSVGSSEQHGS